MVMKWNTKDVVCYVGGGKNPLHFGDEVTDAMLKEMGEETVKERLKNGWLADSVDEAEAKRLELLEEIKALGLKPHYKAGIEKLEKMKADHEALQELKKIALKLGIDPPDNVKYAELQAMIDAAKDKE